MGYVLKRWKMPYFSCMLVGMLVIFAFGGGNVEADPASGCGNWSVVSSPNVPAEQNFLQGVSAIAANDVWGVGFTYNSSGTYETPTEYYC